MVAPGSEAMAALSPPPGYASNFRNPYSLQHYTVLTVAVGLTFTMLALLLRVFTKVYILRDMQVEDYLLISSGAGLVAFSAVLVDSGRSGQGTHQWNLTIEQLQQILNLSNVIEVIYCPVMLMAKLSVLFQLNRIFVVSRTTLIYWLTQVLIGGNICCYLSLALALGLSCIPRAKLWDPELPGHCISSTSSIIASSVINIVSDVTILILPVFAVWQLQLPVKSKLIVSAAFGSGIFASASSIIRLVYSIQLTHTQDFSWGIEPVGLWAIAEISTVILAGSIPILPKFVVWACGKERSGQTSSIPGFNSRRSVGILSRETDQLPFAGDRNEVGGNYPHSGRRNRDSTLARCDTSCESIAVERRHDEIPMRIVKSVHMETTFDSWPI